MAVASVREQHALQAGGGDLLLLKGHAFSGNYGLGAVHKSPEVPGGARRLLLTVDDVVAGQDGAAEACGCGRAHAGDGHMADASLPAG